MTNIMDQSTYQDLKMQIVDSCGSCKTRIAALDVVFSALDPAKPGTARTVRVKIRNGDSKSTKNGDVLVPAKTERERCAAENCGKGLRAESKRCPECSKRVCGKHWNVGHTSCQECVERPG